MNTPEPCCKCQWCRWNVLQEENPEAEAWCEFGYTLGTKNCPKFLILKMRKDNEKRTPR